MVNTNIPQGIDFNILNDVSLTYQVSDKRLL